MNHILLSILILSASLAFGEDLPAPPDPTAPATAVQVPGHWEQQADHTAIWRPASWQIRQGAVTTTGDGRVPLHVTIEQQPTVVVRQPAQQPAQQVIYVEVAPEPAQVIYAPPAPRQVAIYPSQPSRCYSSYGVSNGYYGDSPLLPAITYDWQIYGNQQLRGGHRCR